MSSLSASQATTGQTPHRIPSLDGLRGVSIWAVLAAHAADHFLSPQRNTHTLHWAFSTGAYLGVTVFFVISGFLITSLLMAEREKSGTVRVGRFYRRRAVRILPAFLVYLAVVLILGRPTTMQTWIAVTFTTSIFFHAAYLGLQQLWSLSIEEQFYLTWPVLFRGRTAHAQLWCWLVLIVCPLVRAVLVAKHLHYEHAVLLDSIAAGCLLALYRPWFQQRFSMLYRSGVSFAAVCLAVPLACFGLTWVHSRGWQLEPLSVGIPLLLAMAVGAAVERRDWILNRGLLPWCGLLSYSLYLWQQPFLVMGGPVDRLLLRLPLAFVCAYISYAWIEQPALRWFGKRRAPARQETRIEHETTALV